MTSDNGVQISIEPFQWKDWNALWQLRAHQLAEQGIEIADELPKQPDLNSPYERDYHRLDQVYQRDRGNFWIAWIEDEPVGHIGAEDKKEYIELRRMYVRQAYRRLGIGTRLVRVLIDQCRNQKVGKIELWTAKNGPGRILYEKQGFVTVRKATKTVTNRKGEIRMRLIMRKCELGDITVNYQLVGKGTPLLFLHGSVGDHQPWLHTIEPLFENRSGWKRIYLDLPGHGHTHAPDWLTTDDQVLDVLLRFIDRVIPEQRLVVAGFSWGGYLAQGIVSQRFSEVDGLLLIAPSTHRNDEKKPERTIFVVDDSLLTALDTPLKELATGVLVMQNRRTIDRLQKLSQSWYSIMQDERDFASRYQRGFSFDIDKLTKSYDKPTLFLLGRQDHIVGYRNAWQILENFPRATFAVLDQAGHGIAGIEQFEVSQSLVNDWLDRVEVVIAQ